MTEFTFGGDSTDIPPGTYPGTCTSVTQKTSDKYGDFLAWDFTLESGSVVGGSSSTKGGKKAKAYRWAKALVGGDPEGSTLADLVGKPGLIVVEEGDNGWPKVADVLPPLGAKASSLDPKEALPF